MGRALVAVGALRGWRDRVGAPPGKTLPARLEVTGYGRTREHIARLARLEWSEGPESVATVGVPGGAVALLASDDVDPEAEARRTARRRETLEAEVARARSKLDRPGFVEKAPAPVVQAERDKLTTLLSELAEL